MRYALEWSEKAIADLEKLPEKITWAVLAFCEDVLVTNPQRMGKPLSAPLVGLYSARRGEYRIIYAIHEEVVVIEIANVRHRSQVYRRR